MSYCRFGPDSDVYCYHNGLGWRIYTEKETFFETDIRDLKERFEELDRKGLKIPLYTFERVDDEIKNGLPEHLKIDKEG